MLSYDVSDLQSDIVIDGHDISGTLNYVDDFTGFSSDPELQKGHFIALSWEDYDLTGLASFKVGIVPSASGMSPVEAINDPDKNCVLRVTSNTQRPVFIISDGIHTVREYYSLRNVTLEPET